MNKMKEMQLLLAKIPKGKVSTYGILAKKLKVHPRYVGKLLSKNPDGIKYPCYKVIKSDGSLGGYTSKNGVKDKIKKLRKDGIEIKNNKINLKKYLFKLR
jgi:alkylated DNA nucleotide flippase Atl1